MQRAYSLVPNSIITDKNFDPVRLYKQVRNTGKYNYEQAKIQLPSDINFELLEKLAENYWDYQLPMFLKFGFVVDVKCFRVITQASKGFQIPLIILKCQ